MVQPAWPIHFLVRKVNVTLTISCDLQQAHGVWLESNGQEACVEPHCAQYCARVSGWSLTPCGTLLCLVLCPADFSS